MQRLIINAQQEAICGGETQLSPAHLLLGITHDADCTAAVALVALGVSLDALRSEIQTRIAPCPPDDNPNFHMSPRGKQVINDALYVARTLGDGTIETIDILIGIYSQVGADPTRGAIVPANTISSVTPSEILASQGITRARLWGLATNYHRGIGSNHWSE